MRKRAPSRRISRGFSRRQGRRGRKHARESERREKATSTRDGGMRSCTRLGAVAVTENTRHCRRSVQRGKYLKHNKRAARGMRLALSRSKYREPGCTSTNRRAYRGDGYPVPAVSCRAKELLTGPARFAEQTMAPGEPGGR